MTPINGNAARAVSQSGVTDDAALTKIDLVEIKNRLSRKHRLIKYILGIKNISQHKNLKYRFARGQHNKSKFSDSRLVNEYLSFGKNISLIDLELSRCKNERREYAKK